MRHRIGLALLAGAGFLLLGAGAARADSVTISDGYVGAAPTSGLYTGVDRIGDVTEYDVSSLTASYDNGSFDLRIDSSYMDNVGSDGTRLGDVFLSSNGWSPHGSAPYIYDASTNGEIWEYALVLDDPTSTTGGTVYLYEIAGGSRAPSNGVVGLSGAPSGYIYRAGQEVDFTPSANVSALASGTWSLTNGPGNADHMDLHIDYAGLLAAGSTSLGIHWTMSCGNDVIEGAIPVSPVPEPGSAVLVLMGLVGVLWVTERRRAARLRA